MNHQNFKRILNLQNNLTSVLSTKEIEDNKLLLNIIQEKYSRNTTYKLSIQISRKIFYVQKFKQKKNFLTSYKTSYDELRKKYKNKEFTLEEFIQNPKLIKEEVKYIENKENIQQIHNKNWEKILSNIELVFITQQQQQAKNRKGKLNTPLQNFHTALKQSFFLNKFNINKLKIFLLPHFDLTIGQFKSKKFNQIKNTKEKGRLIISDSIYSIVEENDTDIDKIYTEVILEIKKQKKKYSKLAIINMIQKYKNIISYMSLSGTLNSTKWFMIKVLKEFDNEKNIRLVQILNSDLLIGYENRLSFSDTSFKHLKEVIKFDDLIFKSLKNQTDYDILTNMFFRKKYLWYFNYKYNKKFNSPIKFLFYSIDGIENIYENEEVFFQKIFLNIAVSCFFNEESIYPYINLKQMILAIYLTIRKIKKENINIYKYILINPELMLSNEKLSILQQFSKHYSIKSLQYFTKIEREFNNFKKNSQTKKIPFFQISNKQKDIKIYNKVSLFNVIGFRNQKNISKEEIFKDSNNYIKKLFFEKYIYRKLHTYELEMMLIERLYNFPKINNNFLELIKEEISPKNIYILFIFFHIPSRIHPSINTIKLYKDLKDKSILNIFLDTFFVLSKHFTFENDFSSIDRAMHNFIVYHSIIKRLLIKKTNITIIKKIMYLIKKSTNLTFFINLNLNPILSFNSYNIDYIQKLLLKTNSLQKFINILTEENDDYKKVKICLKGNEHLLPIVKSNKNEKETLFFLEHFKHKEGLVKEEIIDDKIKVEIREDKDLIGFLGSSVSGVCISTSSKERLSHMGREYLNLIVRDDEKIYLWGLLMKVHFIKDVKLEKSVYLMNNLQGSIPTKYKNKKDFIAKKIKKILSEYTSDIYSKNQYFNALELKFSKKLQQEYFFIDKDVRMDFPVYNESEFNLKEKYDEKVIIGGIVGKI